MEISDQLALRACLYEAGWPICELVHQQASPSLYERFDSEPAPSQPDRPLVAKVPSRFCAKLTERRDIFRFFQFYKRIGLVARCDKGSWSTISSKLTNLHFSARASQAGWPVSSIYMRKVSPFRRDPGMQQTASRQSRLGRHTYKHKLKFTKL